MERLSQDKIEDVKRALDGRFGRDVWLRVLEVVDVVGVANSLQLQQATGSSRDKTRALLEYMRHPPQGQPGVLRMLDMKEPATRSRGRPPTVYALSEAGAALIRSCGPVKARPSGLKDDRPIRHALAMLDLYLIASQSGVPILIDHELRYGGGKVLRPDGLVTLPDGAQALFEVEQNADGDTMPRISRSLRNKVEFFKSDEARRVSPIIRLLVNEMPGRCYDRTVETWTLVMKSLLEELKAEPPFGLRIMSTAQFLTTSDWSSDANDDRWINVVRAAQQKREADLALTSASTNVPEELLQRTVHDDHLVIRAMWQYFAEHLCTRQAEFPQPDPETLAIFRTIYAASHTTAQSPLDRATLPYASLYLLKYYLDTKPKLGGRLRSALYRGSPRTNWNTTLVLHRMQVVINEFLAYHGWSSNGWLRAESVVTDRDHHETNVFGVAVRLESPELLMGAGESGVVPSKDEVRQTERALAWVLWALFAHAPRIGFGTPSFW
jgi:hypothetical protein